MQPMPMHQVPVCGVVPGPFYYAVYDDSFLNRGEPVGPYSRATTPMKPMKLSQSSSSKQSSSKHDDSDEKYNRKNKSLGVLATTFLSRFDLTFKKGSILENYEPPTRRSLMNRPEIVIDQLATELSVERRRIYDVVNILEALQLVKKKAKNTYIWMGMDHMTQYFAILQSEAIERWPEQARRKDLIITKFTAENDRNTRLTSNSDGKPLYNPRRDASSKSLTRLSQLFLHVFLVGFEAVTLPEASELIHGSSKSPEDLAVLGYTHESSRLKAAANNASITESCHEDKELKTKIRRLYDIANVFVSVGILSKMEDKTTSNPLARRPHYSWAYHYSLKEIHEYYHKMTLETKLVESGDEEDSDNSQSAKGRKGGKTRKSSSQSSEGTLQKPESTHNTITPPSSSGSQVTKSEKSSATTKKRNSKKSKNESQYL
jgi:transcription factor E2F7/8